MKPIFHGKETTSGMHITSGKALSANTPIVDCCGLNVSKRLPDMRFVSNHEPIFYFHLRRWQYAMQSSLQQAQNSLRLSSTSSCSDRQMTKRVLRIGVKR